MTAQRVARWRLVAWNSPVGPLLLTATLLAGCSGSPTPQYPSTQHPSTTLAAETPEPAAPADICSSPVRPAGAIDIVDRFGRWALGTQSLGKGADPQKAFKAVSASSLGNLENTNVYVVTHGWAPGWNEAVLRAKSKILWWSTAAGVNPSDFGACDPKRQTCEWPSDFAWTGSSTTYEGRPFVISQKGLLPSIVANDPNALVLAYSWLDDSATEGSTLADLECAYHSERYTNLNGLRLASGLRTILGDRFWDLSRRNSLHLIGHSHGSKVVTTAAWALQKNGLQVDQLTILDSPENFETRESGAANFNWLYLADMSISTQPRKGKPQAIFVDNYVSEFSFPYTDFAVLGGVVDVSLDPQKLYTLDPGDDHTYAATWYAGAAAEGRSLQPPVLVGLDWSPVLEPKHTAELDHVYTQTWPQVTPAGQIHLDPSSPSTGTSFSLSRVEFSNAKPSGTAQWNQASQELRFGPGGGGVLSVDFSCSGSSFDYEGVAFDIELRSSATPESQLVVELGSSRYLVIDGDFSLNDNYRISFNAGNESSRLTFRSQAPGTNTGPPPWIIINNFGCIELSSSFEEGVP